MTSTERPDTDDGGTLDALYADLAAEHLMPLWTQGAGLMPRHPQPMAVPAHWRWSTIQPLAARCGAAVPVGRGGERREHPMAWIDGLDIPLVAGLDAGFFEFGPDRLATTATPSVSRNERLWGHPGLRPVGVAVPAASPLLAYRWPATDAALAAQLELEAEGYPGVVEPGHAAVRFTDPATGADALATIRTEMHRLAPVTLTATTRTVGSSVWQVFAGAGTVSIGAERYEVETGDLFTVPSWAPVVVETADGLDAFRFSDEPVYEALGLFRSEREEPSR